VQKEHSAIIDIVKHAVVNRTSMSGNAFPTKDPTLDNCATSVNIIKERKAMPVIMPAVWP
jgi:hypothetical protein